jgi:hypothetical protein
MLAIFEMNVGHAIRGACGEAAPLVDMLGQGDGIKVCAQWFARARRKNRNAEEILYACARAADLIAVAAGLHATCVAAGEMTDEKAADLIAFIFERGVNMEMR